jgi:hypothetical protein
MRVESPMLRKLTIKAMKGEMSSSQRNCFALEMIFSRNTWKYSSVERA